MTDTANTAKTSLTGTERDTLRKVVDNMRTERNALLVQSETATDFVLAWNNGLAVKLNPNGQHGVCKLSQASSVPERGIGVRISNGVPEEATVQRRADAALRYADRLTASILNLERQFDF